MRTADDQTRSCVGELDARASDAQPYVHDVERPLPEKRKNRAARTLSAKKTALSHEAVEADRRHRQRAGPERSRRQRIGGQADENPMSAAAPGRTRTAASSSAITGNRPRHASREAAGACSAAGRAAAKAERCASLRVQFTGAPPRSCRAVAAARVVSAGAASTARRPDRRGLAVTTGRRWSIARLGGGVTSSRGPGHATSRRRRSQRVGRPHRVGAVPPRQRVTRRSDRLRRRVGC